ncbi:tungstate ABC transporter ATP-binding protein TupC [Campylobacter geochelonis]|uniref:Protein YabJ n=1 Tax=Campylobacter geochelonis TaxID=1780362 RepID=A0A128EFF7_9BACT|nr:tungstate ABC transporter ATP-binding protein TupC [Campylobacter geochelonis]QKF71722.1 tungsten ABC transporter TupABC, ATP-binding protein [Campylobacter geochelonis]CZE47656.1 protein YabJ [Campylobacter geochelonis]CZE51140.1 protein YabJ [Campylobacter geochelonis]
MRIENLTQIYGLNLALDVKNLEIDESAITALMGNNGSGKSTLLRIICGIEKPKTGSIISHTPKDKMSILLPEPVLLKRDVGKNFKFALKNSGFEREFSARVGEALELVGLDESFLKKDYYALSSGQTQRVAFAIVLALRSKLILLDEPTNSVDLSTAKLFSKAIEYMKEQYKCGFIIASHDEKWLSAIASNSIFLYNGVVNKFELKNIFNAKDSFINFGQNLSLKTPLNLAKFEQVAIDLSKINLSKTHKNGYLKGILHSVSMIYKDDLLVKIKFGDYLIKAVVDKNEFKNSPLITADEIYFSIKDDAFLGLK